MLQRKRQSKREETRSSRETVVITHRLFVICHLTDIFETRCLYCVRSSHCLPILCIALLHRVVTQLLSASQQDNFPSPNYLLRVMINRMIQTSFSFEELCRVIWEQHHEYLPMVSLVTKASFPTSWKNFGPISVSNLTFQREMINMTCLWHVEIPMEW